MIGCDVALDLLPVYADGAASNATERLVEEHLSVCADCRRALRELRQEKAPRETAAQEAGEYLALSRRIRRRRAVHLVAFGAMALTAAYFIVTELIAGGPDGKEE